MQLKRLLWSMSIEFGGKILPKRLFSLRRVIELFNTFYSNYIGVYYSVAVAVA